MKLFTLTLITSITCASISKRGLGLTTINSPEVNQQQDIESSEGFGFGADGWDSDSTWSSNSFNNVGSFEKLSAIPGFGQDLGGFLFRRTMNLNSWASPDVKQMQSLDAAPKFGDLPNRRLPTFIN